MHNNIDNIDIKDLKIGKELGHGAYGIVYEVKLKTCPHSKYVYKKINERTSFLNEYAIWVQLNNFNIKNIVRCYGVVGSSKQNLGFLLEYATGRKYSKADPVPRNDIKEFAKQSMKCLLQLHAHKIAHNDIHARNMFWESKTKKFTLFDFGCASVKNHSPNYNIETDNHLETDELPVRCGLAIHEKLQNYYNEATEWLEELNPEARDDSALLHDLLTQHLIAHPAPFQYRCMSDNVNLLLTIEKFHPRFFTNLKLNIKDHKLHTDAGMKRILDAIQATK